MKLLLVFAVCFIAVQGDKVPPALQKKVMGYVKECKDEGKVPAGIITDLLQKKLPTDRAGKCFLLCLHKKMGVINEDGTADKAKIDAYVAETKAADPVFGEKIEKIVLKCWDRKYDATDPCDVATLAVECYLNTLSEVGIKM